jgi:acetyl-CoA C-acetyltransferase
MRSKPGTFGLVAANGGIMSKYSVGVYSTEAAEWSIDNSAQLCASIAARPVVAVAEHPDGVGTVETYTVRYDWPVRTGIIVGRLDSNRNRFMAVTEDPELMALLTDSEPLGARIRVRPDGKTNRAVLA